MKSWEFQYLFFEFFQALRRTLGMELDLRQYSLLVEALAKGISADDQRRYDRQGLLSLFKTLWLMNPRYEGFLKSSSTFFSTGMSVFSL
jgi:hypothetical protein